MIKVEAFIKRTLHMVEGELRAGLVKPDREEDTLENLVNDTRKILKERLKTL